MSFGEAAEAAERSLKHSFAAAKQARSLNDELTTLRGTLQQIADMTGNDDPVAGVHALLKDKTRLDMLGDGKKAFSYKVGEGGSCTLTHPICIVCPGPNGLRQALDAVVKYGKERRYQA